MSNKVCSFFAVVKQLMVWRYRGVGGAVCEFTQRCSYHLGDLVQILLLPCVGFQRWQRPREAWS